jgi:hypothetical protein
LSSKEGGTVVFYAKQSPRGFRNEVYIYTFSTRAARDEWVQRHGNDGDMSSAIVGAEPCTAREARQVLGYRGDAITQSFNAAGNGDEAPKAERRSWQSA